jgi:hypothetical protein
MTTYKTAYASGTFPMPIADDAETIVCKMVFNLSAVLASGDVVQFGFLPADHVPVDYAIYNDDLDAAASGAFDFGILTTAGTAISTAAADGGGKWLTASTIIQAAAFTRATADKHLRVTPVAATNRIIAAVMTGSCTTTATGVFGVVFSYKAAQYGEAG